MAEVGDAGMGDREQRRRDKDPGGRLDRGPEESFLT